MGHVPGRVWLPPWLGATRVVPVVLITNRPMFRSFGERETDPHDGAPARTAHH
jgi:hypothetical protein